MTTPFAQASGLNAQPPSPDLAAIAATLNEAAQTLLRLNSPPSAKHEAKQPAPRREEVRCYRFPALAIQCEQELFKDQGVETLQEVLFNASSSIRAFAALLEQVDVQGHLEGMALHMLAGELNRVGKVLFKIQDAYSTVELVKA